MKTYVAAMLCLASAIAFGNKAVGNIVVDGDFETPVVPSPNVFSTYFGGSSFGPWTVTGSTANSVDLETDLPSGSFPSIQGHQFVDLSGQAIGGIAQGLTTTPGQLYSISFQISGSYAQAPTIKTFDLFWGGIKIASPGFDTTGHGPGNEGWTLLQYTATATSSSTILQLQSTSAGAYGPLIDAFDVSPIPEPGTLAVLAVGSLLLFQRTRRVAD